MKHGFKIFIIVINFYKKIIIHNTFIIKGSIAFIFSLLRWGRPWPKGKNDPEAEGSDKEEPKKGRQDGEKGQSTNNKGHEVIDREVNAFLV